MDLRMPVLRGYFLGSTFLLLAACSNGGGDGISGGDAVQTGQLIDSAVSGIRYETATGSGVTDSEGRFGYLEGETVSFYLGDMLLGEAQGAATVSPFDLVEAVDPVVGNTLLQKAIRNRKDGPSFSTVINLATLLQTLDSDGNPDNGIEISADVAALFKPDSLELNRHWQDFIHDPGFRQALKEAKAGALLDGDRQIRKPWRAMAHLYASLGIDSKLKPVTGNALIAADGFPVYSAAQEFDAEGQLTQVSGGSGFTNASIQTFAYDASGNLVREERDSLFPSGTDGIYFYLYDGDGNLVRREVGTDGNETPGTGIDATYEYVNDDQGKRLLEAFDNNGDGVPESSRTYFYDSEGYLLRSEYDSDGDGTPDSTNSYAHDAVGNLVHLEFDSNADGMPETSVDYTYDTVGNLVREFHYRNNDASSGRTYTYLYDADGILARREYDSNGDGITDTIDAYSYNDEGNLGLIESYAPDSEDAKSEETFAYESNADGWWWLFDDGATGGEL
jgi:YD repeat-containing protein